MALLKFKINTPNKIITFYYETCERVIQVIKNCVMSINNLSIAIKKRIRYDYNLSDLGAPGQSKATWQAEARINLEIVGNDVKTHNHNKLYDTMIKEMRGRIHSKEQELNRLISNFRNCDGHCEEEAKARQAALAQSQGS